MPTICLNNMACLIPMFANSHVLSPTANTENTGTAIRCVMETAPLGASISFIPFHSPQTSTVQNYRASPEHSSFLLTSLRPSLCFILGDMMIPQSRPQAANHAPTTTTKTKILNLYHRLAPEQDS